MSLRRTSSFLTSGHTGNRCLAAMSGGRSSATSRSSIGAIASRRLVSSLRTFTSGSTVVNNHCSPRASHVVVRTNLPAIAYGANAIFLRSLSSSNKSDGGGDAKSSADTGGPEQESSEIVLTPGQKVVAGTRLTMWAGIFCFASACAYYIGKELLPTKMSPNAVFDRATAVVRDDAEVKRRFGEPLKAYGRDHGGHREGRRNFVEHTEYTDSDDGTKRTRVRFNLEGKFGKAFVFAEVSSDMPSGEFVYVLVQDKANGRVFTVVDNRSRIAAARMAGGNKEGMEALSNLLGGGSKK